MTGKIRRLLKGKDSSFLLKKAFWAFLFRGGGMVTQYLFVFLVARFAGAHTLGVFTLSYTILQLAVVISILGLDNLLVRILAAEKAAGNFKSIKGTYFQFISITLLTSLISASLIYFFADQVANYVFNKAQLASSLRMIALAIPPFVMMAVNSAAFRGYKLMAGFLGFRALIPLLGALILLILIQNDLQSNPVLCFNISVFITAILSFFCWNRYSKLNNIPSEITKTWKEQLRTAYPMMLTGSVFFILGWTDNLILGIFRTETEVGIYDTAFKIAAASSIVLMAVNAIQAPSFAEMHSRGETQKLKNYVFNSTRLTFFITLPLSLMIFIFPKQILSIFGPGFESGWIALYILAIGNFISAISGSVGLLLQMTGHQQAYNKIITVTALGSVIVNFILVPGYGIMGAALVSATAKLVQILASVNYAYRKLNILSIYIPGLHNLIRVKTNPKDVS